MLPGSYDRPGYYEWMSFSNQFPVGPSFNTLREVILVANYDGRYKNSILSEPYCVCKVGGPGPTRRADPGSHLMAVRGPAWGQLHMYLSI